VPVEARMAGRRAGGDRGHHDIAAIARVAGHDPQRLLPVPSSRLDEKGLE
jgi:hypothetical protein